MRKLTPTGQGVVVSLIVIAALVATFAAGRVYAQGSSDVLTLLRFPMRPMVGTCGTTAEEGEGVFVPRNGLVGSRACMCTRDGLGGFKWVNLLGPSLLGASATNCPSL